MSEFTPDTLARRQMDLLFVLLDGPLETVEAINRLQRAYADPPPAGTIREDLHLLLEGGYIQMAGVEETREWRLTETGEEWLRERRDWEAAVGDTATSDVDLDSGDGDGGSDAP